MQANVKVPVLLATKQETTTTKPLGQSDETVQGQFKKNIPGNNPAAHLGCPRDLTLNVARTDGDGQKPDNRNKTRRIWSAFEEARFFEVWGRDNWLLTRRGKNTVVFAKWANELRDIHGINIMINQIQLKVNNTRAKFRSVRKAMIAEGATTARWKKYNMVNSILKNQYRSADADPIPKEALEHNRDMTPPPSKTTSSVPAKVTHTSVITSQAGQVIFENTSELNISGYFNPNEVGTMCLTIDNELFTNVFVNNVQEHGDPAFRSSQMQPDDPNAENAQHEIQIPLQLLEKQQQF